MNRSAARAPAETDEVSAVLDALRQINQELRVSARAVEQELGVSGAQLAVLRELAKAPARSLGELAQRTFTRHSSVSVVVQRLVATGLVERQRAPSDARRVVLTLTRAGRALLREMPEEAQERLLASANRLPRARLAELVAGLRALAHELAGTNAARVPRAASAPRVAPRRRRSVHA